MSEARRLGRFSVSAECMPDVCDDAKLVFEDVSVIERRNSFEVAGVFEFLAEGDVFDEVEAGHLIPEYTIQITRHFNDDGHKTGATHRWCRRAG